MARCASFCAVQPGGTTVKTRTVASAGLVPGSNLFQILWEGEEDAGVKFAPAPTRPIARGDVLFVHYSPNVPVPVRITTKDGDVVWDGLA